MSVVGWYSEAYPALRTVMTGYTCLSYRGGGVESDICHYAESEQDKTRQAE